MPGENGCKGKQTEERRKRCKGGGEVEVKTGGRRRCNGGGEVEKVMKMKIGGRRKWKDGGGKEAQRKLRVELSSLR